MPDELQSNEQQVTHRLRDLLSPDFTFTKRQLGIMLLIAGSLAFVVIFAMDFVGAGREGGIGPAQQAALGVSILTALIGASLIPLGDRPV
jgi:lipopolysaccharide export LptBFGC system permease protein LptF